MAVVSHGIREYWATIGDAGYAVRIVPEGKGVRVTVDGVDHWVSSYEREGRSAFLLLDSSPQLVELRHEGEERYRVHSDAGDLVVAVRNPLAARLKRSAEDPNRKRMIELRAPMPGLVVSVAAQVGAHVGPETALVVLEAMKMQNALTSPAAGIVREVRVAQGQTVEGETLLVVLERAESPAS
jgi:biotin carboxyl carrier protein